MAGGGPAGTGGAEVALSRVAVASLRPRGARPPCTVSAGRGFWGPKSPLLWSVGPQAPEGRGPGSWDPRGSCRPCAVPWPSSPHPSTVAAAGGALRVPLLATWPKGSLASGHPPPSTEAPAGARLLPAVGHLPCDLPWCWPLGTVTWLLVSELSPGPSSQSSYVPLTWFMSPAVPSEVGAGRVGTGCRAVEPNMFRGPGRVLLDVHRGHRVPADTTSTRQAPAPCPGAPAPSRPRRNIG